MSRRRMLGVLAAVVVSCSGVPGAVRAGWVLDGVRTGTTTGSESPTGLSGTHVVFENVSGLPQYSAWVFENGVKVAPADGPQLALYRSKVEDETGVRQIATVNSVGWNWGLGQSAARPLGPWYTAVKLNEDIETIAAAVEGFNSVTIFHYTQGAALADWMTATLDDDYQDVLWTQGTMPREAYAHLAVNDDSLLESWLDGSNMVMNTGDFINYRNDTGEQTGAAGLADIMDGPSVFFPADYKGWSRMWVTSAGASDLPSLGAEGDIVYAHNAPHLTGGKLGAAWSIEEAFAHDNGMGRYDPVVIRNEDTGARIVFMGSACSSEWGESPRVRPQVIIEFLNNWYPAHCR